MSDMLTALLSRIQTRTATVGIIGLGYVGLPLARAFARTGFKVLGFDIDPVKVGKLNAGKSYIQQIPDSTIMGMREKGFEATDRFDRLAEPDAILICVPTPLTESRTRSQVRRRFRSRDRGAATPRPTRRSRKHHVSYDHAQGGAADLGTHRDDSRQGVPARVQPRA